MGCIESKSDNNGNDHDDSRPKGVSVHWLNGGFLKEVEDYGKDPTSSKIYEIENLRGENGLIRLKGQNTICPRDGRLGAAYVDCLEGEDNVGKANVMLSYGWGNLIGDVALTLMDHCNTNELDPKRTYVWICCLCNNQFRVAENRKLGREVPFEEFEAIFRTKVLGINNIVALMAPWNDPIYLSRVWCIFELFTAHKHGCNLTIAMPPREKASLIQTVNTVEGVSTLFNVFASTAVENAQASEESDKVRILSMVEGAVGFAELNNQVNAMLRKWVNASVMETVGAYIQLYDRQEPHEEQDQKDDQQQGQAGGSSTNTENYAALGLLCNQVGYAMNINGEHEEALSLLSKSLEITRNAFGDDHIHCSSICDNIGLALMDMGQYENALAYFRKSLNIMQLSTDEASPVQVAKTVMSIGAACYQLDNYKDAMECYEWSLDLFTKSVGEEHEEVANNYDNLGSVYRMLQKNDEAMDSYKKGIKIRKKLLGEAHPDIALSYNNYASLLSEEGKQEEALEYFQKALEVEKKILGEEHYSTAITIHNIGLAFDRQRDFDKALEFYQRSMEIKLKVLGTENHPSVSSSYLGIGAVMGSLGKMEESLKCYKKALEIHRNTTKEENSSAATLYNNMACVLSAMERYGESLEYFEKAHSIWSDALGPENDKVVNLVNSMDLTREKMNHSLCNKK